MAGAPEKSYGAVAIEVLDALRIARATGGLLLDHVVLAAELVRLEWQEEKTRLRQLVQINLALVVLISLTLLHLSALAIAVAWDTRYRLYVMSAMLLFFLISTVAVWRHLQQLSDQDGQQFTESRRQIEKSLELLKRHL